MMIAGHQVDDTMFSYIARNLDADTCKLLLKAEPSLSFDKSFAILQIECRRKAKNKIPELLAYDHFLFPKAISAEQCTHQLVARFHASLFHGNKRVLDMTMGLGVDDFYISQCVKELTAVEIDPEIADVGKHNFAFLASNVNVINADSVNYLAQLGRNEHFDTIFIDPARRGDSGKRLYSFADCLPNVLELVPSIKLHSKRLLIKASPMLDVTQSMRELGENLTDVWAVSVKNECKELLFGLDFENSKDSVSLHALNQDGNMWQHFSAQSTVEYAPLPSPVTTDAKFLYEPNASIMKLGCYSAVEQAFELPMLSSNSHLLLSNHKINDFPGREFRILEIIPFKSKEIKLLKKRYPQANVATRNFRINADALKKRLGVQDGGITYLFATTLSSGEQVLFICEKP